MDAGAPRLRVALVDPVLADCDRLDRAFAGNLEIALVLVDSSHSAVARWAELGGYPCADDLRALSAAVVDAWAVGSACPRRAEVLALASIAGLRAVVLPPGGPPPAGEQEPAAAPALSPDAARPSAETLDEAFEQLFGTSGRPEP